MPIVLECLLSRYGYSKHYYFGECSLFFCVLLPLDKIWILLSLKGWWDLVIVLPIVCVVVYVWKYISEHFISSFEMGFPREIFTVYNIHTSLGNWKIIS